jgi:hypothetical protein
MPNRIAADGLQTCIRARLQSCRFSRERSAVRFHLSPHRNIFLAVALLLCAVAAAAQRPPQSAPPTPPPQMTPTQLILNDRFIDAVNGGAALDLADARQVFRLVFSSLPDEVVVYPSENYYYFVFSAQGKTFWGSIALFVEERDSGILNFGYAEKIDKFHQPCFPIKGGSAAFTARDGVALKKLNDFRYYVTFENKTRFFQLNQLILAPPKKARLTADETYVGPSFDESGLMFFLVYNQSEPHLYWLLDEDGYVAETFAPLGDDLVIGERTEFAFYLDRANQRKILVGVEGLNTLQNNWYDGPFDQLPDNHIRTGAIELKSFLEKAYPAARGRIDKYGNYLDSPGSRVAVAPYLVYFSRNDLLDTIEACKSAGLPPAKFYSCITQPVFKIPDSVLRCESAPGLK